MVGEQDGLKGNACFIKGKWENMMEDKDEKNRPIGNGFS